MSSGSSDEDFMKASKSKRSHSHSHGVGGRRYKKSHDDIALGQQYGGDQHRHRVNKYSKHRRGHGGAETNMLRSRSQSPGQFLDEDEPIVRGHRHRSQGNENINPHNPPARSRHRTQNSSKSAKHTVITREHRLGLRNTVNTKGAVGGSGPMAATRGGANLHGRHIRDLSSSSSSSANTYLPPPPHHPSPDPYLQYHEQHRRVHVQRPHPNEGGIYPYNQQQEDYVEDHYDEDDSSLMIGPGEDVEVVVGYVGTIEYPHSLEKHSSGANSFYHVLHTTLRRLRVEKKLHTLILVQIDPMGVRLINIAGDLLASYEPRNIRESMLCPDDEQHYFGIATTRSSDDEVVGCSCHVFMVDPELSYHGAHMKEAQTFGIQCTRNPGSDRCRQFPYSAKPIIACLSGLSQQQYALETTPNTTNPSDILSSSTSNEGRGGATPLDPAADNSSIPTNPSSNSSYNQSVEITRGGPAIIESPQGQGQVRIGSSVSVGLLYGQKTSTPLKTTAQIRGLTVTDSNPGAYVSEQQPGDRLGVRARPHPFGYSESSTPDAQANAEQIRKAVPHVLNSLHPQQLEGDEVETSPEMSGHLGLNAKERLNATDEMKEGIVSPVPPLPPRLPRQPAMKNLISQSDISQLPSATIGKRTGASPLPVAIPRVPPSAWKPPLPLNNHSQNTFSRMRTLKKPPATPPTANLIERPKSTPPMRGFDPEVPIHEEDEEDYDSDPGGNLSALTDNFDESWSGRIPETNETPLKMAPPPPPDRRVFPILDPRRHSEGVALHLKRGEKDDGGASLAGKITKSGSFKHFKQKQRGHIAEAHDSLVVPSEGAATTDYNGGVGIPGNNAAAGNNNHLLPHSASANVLQTTSAPSSTVVSRQRILTSNSATSLSPTPGARSNSSAPGGTAGVTGAGSGERGGDGGQQDEVGRAASWAVDFDKLLADKIGLATFTEFLKKEYSQENIVFWTKVESYRTIEDEHERKKRAQDLYKDHLGKNAGELVNVDATSRIATEELLPTGSKDVFKVAQKHIYTLMKQDSYSRFLKSPLYKDSVLAEMEGRPLPFSEEDAVSIDSVDSGNAIWDRKGLKKQPSGSSTEEGGEKRRRSMLPWNRNKSEKRIAKRNTESDLLKGKNTVTSGRPSLDLPAVKQISKEIKAKDSEDSSLDKPRDQKFCRVMLPDGSTTVLEGGMAEKLSTVLAKLCDRRNLVQSQLDVFIDDQDKPLDTACDFSVVASKELRLERRVILRLDIPTLKKSIGVKGKVKQTVGEVVKAAAARYGMKDSGMVLYKFQSSEPVDMEENVLAFDNQRLVLHKSEEFKDWGLVIKVAAQKNKNEKHGVTEANIETLFSELFEGSATLNILFDEHGILDPETKKPAPSAPPRRSASASTLFTSLVRSSNDQQPQQNSVSRLFKSGSGSGGSSAKLNRKDTISAAAAKKRLDAEDEKVFELLGRVGAWRLEDQRGVLRPQDLELPNFLRQRNGPQAQVGPSSSSTTAAPPRPQTAPQIAGASSSSAVPPSLKQSSSTPSPSKRPKSQHLMSQSSISVFELCGSENNNRLKNAADGGGASSQSSQNVKFSSSVDIIGRDESDMRSKSAMSSSNLKKNVAFHNSDSSLYETSLISGQDSNREGENISKQESNNIKQSVSQENLASRGSCVSARSLQISPSKIPFADQSFDGKVPSHTEADIYFSGTPRYDEEVNFDDSKLMERTLRDIGLESKPVSNSPRNGVFLSGVRVNTPISELRQRLSNSPRKTVDVGRSDPPLPVPKPRVPKRRQRTPQKQQKPFAAAAAYHNNVMANTTTANTRLSPGSYIAQDGDVEITLLPPSSTDSEESSDRLSAASPSLPPSAPPSIHGTLSKSELANYSPPAPLASQENSPLPTPPVRSRKRTNGSASSNTPTPPKPAQRPSRFPLKFTESSSRSEASSSTTPSPTTHDLILDSFVPAETVPELASVPNGGVNSQGSNRKEIREGGGRTSRGGGRTRRVLAVDFEPKDEADDKDVQVSYV